MHIGMCEPPFVLTRSIQQMACMIFYKLHHMMMQY